MIDAALRDFCKWLAATPLSNTIQTNGWIIPALQTIHILGVAVAFSSAILVDLRIWRLLNCDIPLADVVRRFLPPIWPVLLILLLTGSLLIVGEPRRTLLNAVFYVKIALLALALMLTSVLEWSLLLVPEFWEKDRWQRMVGRFAAALSIVVWCGIIFAGRWIAYTQVG